MAETGYNWPLITGVLIAVGLYWAYCIYWSIVGYRQARTLAGWGISGRTLPPWLFLLAASVTSFSAWTYMGHPGTVYAGGLAYAFAGLYAITIPFTGALFLKRQWMLGRRYGFITPPEQYRTIFDSNLFGMTIVVVSFLYSCFYVAVQLIGSGLLFTVITGGFFPFIIGSVALALIMLIYVGAGGLRTIAWVDALQYFLVFGGITLIGASVLYGFGGWASFMDQVTTLHTYYTHSHGWVLWSWNWVGDVGGIGPMVHWTGIMMLTYMFALAGIQASPAFTMWAYSMRHARLIAWQVTVGIGTVVTATLVLWSVVQGMGARIHAHQDPGTWGGAALVNFIRAAGAMGAGSDGVVPMLMLNYLPLVLIPLAAIGLLAAAQSTAGPYVSSFAAIATRNIVGETLLHRARRRARDTAAASAVGADVTAQGEPRRIRDVFPEQSQVHWSRFFCLVLLGCALYVAFAQRDLMVMLGGLAVSYGFQLYPALIVTCYGFRGWPMRWTPQGILAGLIMGIIFVTLSYIWVDYRYTLSIHSAGWGIIFNLLTICAVSTVTSPSRTHEEWMQRLDSFYRRHDPAFYEPKAQAWRRFLWFYIPFWWIMFVGPGIEFGNYLDGVVFGLPGLWTWLILGGLTGVFLLWSMCWPAQMATAPRYTPQPRDETALASIDHMRG
ncbi:sodium:solute symporter family protein [Elioraea sp.]|uniref:sodium:solute symporter family protein n=1 Tax=Elioraea sp. TaxID=2185103 RepID=UPI003F6F71F7